MSTPVYLTKEGLNKLEEDLRYLKTKGRAEIAEKIAYARSHGDLSENADYDAAKHEQELLEMKIARIEGTLKRAQVIDPKEFPEGKAYILSNVKLHNKKNNAQITYTLVSEEEADFLSGKLAVNSPLGKALLGKAVGDSITIKAPAGAIEYEILEIWK